MRRADNLTTFMCWLSWNLGASSSWNPQGLSRPVMELVYLVHDWVQKYCLTGLKRYYVLEKGSEFQISGRILAHLSTCVFYRSPLLWFSLPITNVFINGRLGSSLFSANGLYLSIQLPTPPPTRNHTFIHLLFQSPPAYPTLRNPHTTPALPPNPPQYLTL